MSSITVTWSTACTNGARWRASSCVMPAASSNNLGSRYVSPGRAPVRHARGSRRSTPTRPTRATSPASSRCSSEAARRGVDAGFDILYVHGTHGALPVQMLSRHYNRRTDRYGGDFENRARLWVEILEAVREAADGQCAVATRFSIDQLSGPARRRGCGRRPALRRARHRLGLLDLWDVNISSLRGVGRGCRALALLQIQPPGAVDARGRSIAKVPVVGRRPLHRSRRDGARAAGPASSTSSAAPGPSIADPWLPRKIDEGRSRGHRRMHRLQPVHRALRIRRADRLHAERDGAGGVSPRLASRTLRAAPQREQILVVGAGPAGLECARVLGRRGYASICARRSTTLGGHLRHVAALPGLAEWGRVVELPRGAAPRMAQVEVLRGTGAVTAEDVLNLRRRQDRAGDRRRLDGDGRGSAGRTPSPASTPRLPGFVTPEQLFAGKADRRAAWRSSTATATSWP